ncbi:hypothetical protein [Celeribacter indicus]|uniref:Permease n=1 Tax=Celeribacter indicus TaxID=1208324 RepID=A0A0B5E023_9RHOB|nr:hypothetical protein [Celeribacter indicus]AJE45802.1 hypothetical protein P73_1087 [Celeribacter indicus]SDW61017.1 hypothetical protein SAMN05443573_10530 [Celeribacter indicus]
MNILFGTILICTAAVWLWSTLPNAEWRRASYAAAIQTLKFTLPRVLVALLGAGFFADLLPADLVRSYLGQDAGLSALALAMLLGPLTPGGAFVSFAIGAAALKAGAGVLPVLVYVTAWSLFSLTKLLSYELSFMGRQATMMRLAVSLPIPLLLAALAGQVI